MPKLSMAVPHSLGQAEASERLKGLLARIKERHQDSVSNLQEEWLEDGLRFSFTTFGFKIAGLGTVGPSDVNLDIDLPFAALMFKGKIEQEMRDTLTRVLS